MTRIRSFVLILVGAVLGALAGRAFAQARRQQQAGEPVNVDPASLRVRPPEVVPGIVAGLRMGEAPWSWLHVPGWFAAFTVNFAGAALAGDFGRLRDMLEAAGITTAAGPVEETGYNGHEAPVWTADAPPAGETPGPPPQGFRPFAD
jgi:hypothetical protein